MVPRELGRYRVIVVDPQGELRYLLGGARSVRGVFPMFHLSLDDESVQDCVDLTYYKHVMLCFDDMPSHSTAFAVANYYRDPFTETIK